MIFLHISLLKIPLESEQESCSKIDLPPKSSLQSQWNSWQIDGILHEPLLFFSEAPAQEVIAGSGSFCVELRWSFFKSRGQFLWSYSISLRKDDFCWMGVCPVLSKNDVPWRVRFLLALLICPIIPFNSNLILGINRGIHSLINYLSVQVCVCVEHPLFRWPKVSLPEKIVVGSFHQKVCCCWCLPISSGLIGQCGIFSNFWESSMLFASYKKNVKLFWIWFLLSMWFNPVF